MPNMQRFDKRNTSIPGRRGSLQRATKPRSAKDLLHQATPGLRRVTEHVAQQQSWQEWLETRLPAELAVKLSGVVEREGTLTLFAESAAWSARMRFAAQELDEQIRAAAPRIDRIRVRVLPRAM